MKRILNNAISLGVVVIVLFLIIPLPTQLLDFLLIINIGLSIMILMITMNISDALEFSIFPSLLLVTTLFRLGLNVSTTRRILGFGGDAGNVILAFGQMVMVIIKIRMDNEILTTSSTSRRLLGSGMMRNRTMTTTRRAMLFSKNRLMP